MTDLQIMLPMYGDAGLARLTVDSVLAQRNPAWRLTIVDDGLRDESLIDYLTGLDDERVEYLRNEGNLGINGNFSKCLSLAGAEYVVIMGADDLMHPNYVDTVLRVAKGFPQAAVIQPGVAVIDETGAPARTFADTAKQRLYMPKVAGSLELSGERLAASLLRSNWMYFPSLCFRRAPAAAIGFRPGLSVVLDLALVVDLVCRGESLVVDDELCFSYRRHSASESSWKAVEGSRFAEERAYFLDAADQVAAIGWHRAAKAARLHMSSRLNAVTRLPTAMRARQPQAVRVLTRHAFGAARREAG